MQNEKTDIKSLLPEELRALLAGMGEPAYRAGQIFAWLARGVSSFDEMTNLPLSLREKLGAVCRLNTLKLVKKQVSRLDGTIKFLWELFDGNAVETVFMRYHHGNTVCISTQVGCRMGCAFCASAIGSLVRNLTPAEMLDEVLQSEGEAGEPVSNVVLMGIGEPLDNFDNVMRFLALVNHPEGRAVGMRHISLSTCGLTEKFDKLAEHPLQLTLSVSLHAPDDETRNKLMPINRRHNVEELLRACETYFHRTGRRVSLEYTLIGGVNDTGRHAALLAEEAKRLGAHVNLIRLNGVSERAFRPSTEKDTRAFLKVLESAGANATLRRALGRDIDASCGQLRRKMMDGDQT